MAKAKRKAKPAAIQRISGYFPNELGVRARWQAAKEGIRISELVVRAVEQYLARHRAGARKVKGG